jgi:lysophospholipase L1-like esterase
MLFLHRHSNAYRSPIRSTLRIATALGAAWAALQGFRLLYSRHHRINTNPFSNADEHGLQDSGLRRFLIVGDSTGVGIGSADSRSTVAGRLAAAFPGTEIVNHARDGAQSSDVAAQIESGSGRFDLVLIFVGGNDAIRLSSYEAVVHAAESALEAARACSDSVAVIPPTDVGAAPLWMWPLDALFTHRARAVRRAWQLATRERTGVHLVEVRLPKNRDPFRIAPRRYYSPDGVHPSADGYALWFAQITRQVPLFARLS